MRISDVMTRNPVCCTPRTPLPEVAKLMLTHDCGSIPVCDGPDCTRVLGVVTDRDIAIRAVASGRNVADMAAGDIMSHPVACVTLDDTLEECVKKLEKNQVRRAPVVDEQGRVVGIVAQADVARSANPKDLAELVHEVSKGPGIGHEV